MPEGATVNAPEVPTYGGWRQARGIGLFGLDVTETLVVLGAVMVGLILVSFNFKWFAMWIIPGGLIVAATVVRFQGETLRDRVQRRVQWTWGSMRGYRTLRGGVL
ncbi:MAG: hypothetical protein LC808_08555, partial [Actinobacteria bacterium]|nr:hypothetical protein [Actinomycetota bacterium]